MIVSEKITDGIFSHIIALVPELQHVNKVITDLDKDIVTTLRKTFPEAKLRCSMLYAFKV